MYHWSEAASRNQGPILEVLRDVLYPERFWRVLEIGTGTGQHAIYFTRHLQHIEWQTSDLPHNHDAIALTLQAHSHARVNPPLALEASTLATIDVACDAVYTANTCHIMSWPDVLQMFEHVGAMLPPSGRFVVYGPFHAGGQPTSESNYRFDQYLSQANPRQGVRNREDIAWLANRHGLSLIRCIEMPANNQILVFEKRSDAFAGA